MAKEGGVDYITRDKEDPDRQEEKHKNNMYTNLENYDFTHPTRVKIDSPRSKEALMRLGFTQEELYYISFNEFKKKYTDTLTISKDMQKKRFENYENKRLEKLNAARELRFKLAATLLEMDDYSQIKNRKERNNISRSVGRSVQSDVFSNNNNQNNSTAIKNDLKAFERLKKKQEMDLLGMVQHELKLEIIRKENEEKMKMQREKEETYRRELLINHRKEEEYKKQLEKEKQEQIKRDEEERKKREQERFNEEQKKMKDELMKEKLRMQEYRIKQEEEKKKQGEHKLLLEMNLEENNRKAEIRQKELAEKEKNRQEILEQKKYNLALINMEKAQKKQVKIEQNMLNLEEKLLLQKMEFTEKQRRNELKKKKFDELHELAFKQKKKESLLRAEGIKKVLEKNERIEKQRLEDYNNKQKMIELKKQKIEEELSEVKQEKSLKHKDREKKIKNALIMNEEIEMNKKYEILNKIELKESKYKELNMKKEREMMERNEEVVMRRFEKQDNLKHIARIQEYEKNKVKERLDEKSLRLEEFKMQKNLIADKKREMQDEINRKKQEYTEKFNKILKKRNFNDSTIGTLRKMFPDNEEILSMVMTLRSNDPLAQANQFRNRSRIKPNNFNYGNNESKRTSFMNNSRNDNSRIPTLDQIFKSNIMKKNNHNSNSVNKINSPNKSKLSQLDMTQTTNNSKSKTKRSENILPPLTDKDITKKLDEYRLILNKNLLKLLSEERMKEEERERIMSITNDSNERLKLENIFGYERAKTKNKIVSLNEEIERKIEEYEKKLRSTNRSTIK